MLVDYWYMLAAAWAFSAGEPAGGCWPGLLPARRGNESPTSAVSLASDYLHAAEIRTFAFLL